MTITVKNAHGDIRQVEVFGEFTCPFCCTVGNPLPKFATDKGKCRNPHCQSNMSYMELAQYENKLATRQKRLQDISEHEKSVRDSIKILEPDHN